MLYEGILIGLVAFLVIGLFHPLIVKGEYRFSHEIWPFFLFAGFTGLAAAAIARNLLLSSALGVFGFTALWSIGELFSQRERVRKGWFPARSEAAFELRRSALPKMKLTARAIGESAFNLLYLIAILTIAIVLSLQPDKQRYGLACMALFIGDACHLLPRIYALTHGGTDRFPTSVGIGKLITSLTMGAFYFMLAPNAAALVFLLARIVLCVLPMNRWTGKEKPVVGIVRNIPLLAMGAIAAATLGFPYAIAIAVGFLFYIPVVLFARKKPKLGMLMLPKSCAYIVLAVWLVIV